MDAVAKPRNKGGKRGPYKKRNKPETGLGAMPVLVSPVEAPAPCPELAGTEELSYTSKDDSSFTQELSLHAPYGEEAYAPMPAATMITPATSPNSLEYLSSLCDIVLQQQGKQPEALPAKVLDFS